MRQNPKQLENGRWQADWRDATGKRTRKSFRTKDAAQKALRDAMDARDRNEVPMPPVPTLKEFLDSQGRRAVRERVDVVTWENYERNLRLHILPHLGELKLSEIDPPTLQRWVFTLRDAGAGAATIHRSFATLSGMMKLGSALGYCAIPSKSGLMVPREVSAKFAVPTVADIERLANEIDPRFYALIIVAGYMGLRQSELFGLRPESIDWDERKILVWEKLDRKRNRVAKTKSGHDRAVTMPDNVAVALRRHLAAYPDAEWVFHRGGRPIDASWFYPNVWVPARRNAGLPQCRFHDLRHAAVGVMATVWKWGPKRVQMELGHHSAGFTMDRYGGYWLERDENEQERMSQQLGDALKKSGRSEGSRTLRDRDSNPDYLIQSPAGPSRAEPDVDLRALIDPDWNQHG